MLDVLSYPVSLLLWLWHSAFAFLLGGSNVLSWALAIMFLVFTLRALLLRPAIAQARFTLKMRALAPRLAGLRERYGGDRDRHATELQKLLGEHKVSPLGGFLPMLLQLPVFVGLNQVLRALTSVPVGETYVFSAADVTSFLDAKLFGVHLGDAVLQISTQDMSLLWEAVPVALPLMLLAALTTYLTTRLTPPAATETRWLRALRYVPPVAVLGFGAVLPVGLLVYWVSNGLWTLGQQYLLLHRGKPDLAADRR